MCAGLEHGVSAGHSTPDICRAYTRTRTHTTGTRKRTGTHALPPPTHTHLTEQPRVAPSPLTHDMLSHPLAYAAPPPGSCYPTSGPRCPTPPGTCCPTPWLMLPHPLAYAAPPPGPCCLIPWPMLPHPRLTSAALSASINPSFMTPSISSMPVASPSAPPPRCLHHRGSTKYQVAQGSGFRAEGTGVQASGNEAHGTGFGNQTQGSGLRARGFRHQGMRLMEQGSGITHRVRGSWPRPLDS